MAARDDLGNGHLIQTFLTCVSRTELAKLQVVLDRKGPQGVDGAEFDAVVRETIPTFRLPVSSFGADGVRAQAALLAELFKQLDTCRRGRVTWNDIASLAFASTTNRKQPPERYNPTPKFPVFEPGCSTKPPSSNPNPFYQQQAPPPANPARDLHDNGGGSQEQQQQQQQQEVAPQYRKGRPWHTVDNITYLA
eukprot:gene22105-33909_t